MVVFVMENVPEKLRGEITRWMLEAKAGVFVGNMSATVRALLWKKIIEGAEGGSALLIHSSDSEQGFNIEMTGLPKRSVVYLEGLNLIATRE
jgi:CRISPR-associated protein Cas2